MDSPCEQQRLEALKRAILADVVACTALETEGGDLAQLAQIQQAELALQRSSDAGAGSSWASAAPAAAHAWLSGDEDAPLGVSPQALRSLAPSPGAARAAVAALLPAVERELQRRCGLCAAAAGYDGDDPRGLGDHAAQLSAAVEDARAARADGWARAAVAAQQATRLLAAAGGSTEGVLRRHTLGGVREADAARCEALRARAARLAAKLADAVVQLRSATYTPDTLPALREVERQLSSALAERRSEAKLRGAVLAQCRAVGPELLALAAAHAALQAQLADAEYELSELGRYQELAAVLARQGGAGA